MPALLGNGSLVTTVGRTGYHEPAGDGPPRLYTTQEFVLAGRRLPGPRHELIPFGKLQRGLTIDGAEPHPRETSQSIHTDIAEVRTRRLYENLLESTRTVILAHRNCFIVETRLTNFTEEDVGVVCSLDYSTTPRGEATMLDGLQTDYDIRGSRAEMKWAAGDNLGVVTLWTDAGVWQHQDSGFRSAVARTLGPGDEVVLRSTLSFSDRIDFQNPLTKEAWEPEMRLHAARWRDFWDRSEVVTGDERVDAFRHAALYTIACQATPWSVPPTVSKPYWDGGAFHDEYYPFIALLSGGWDEMAARMPYFRHSTLHQATARGRSRGALYPWSSTEDGRERDPHGHWYTERFHLGQIAACAWFLWLYQRRREYLEELYPVIRECARYFQNDMLERMERGGVRTRACTDFDESIGQISAGPFTMAAAAFLFDRGAEAARRVGRDRELSYQWESLGRELQQHFQTDPHHKRYVVPGGNAQHSSILGYIVPFFADDGSEISRNSLRFIHKACKTALGWKPGEHEAFDGTTWMWTAGHLAMCHSVMGNAEEAWEAVRAGPASAGQFFSPNERLTGEEEPVVPWFTTGCGAWLSGLHWMFARVDDNGDQFLPAVPESLKDFQIRGLRLSRGVSVTARAAGGKLAFLSFHSPAALTFSFEVPLTFIEGVWPAGVGRIVDLSNAWRIQLDLIEGETVIIE